MWWHRDELTVAVVVSPLHLLLCVLCTAGYLAANGLLSHAMVTKLGGRIPLWESLNLSLVATAGNALSPMQGGMVVRAIYLKRLHNFQYARFLSTLVGCQVLTMMVGAGLATWALGWMVFVEHRQGVSAILGGVALCLGLAVLASLLPPLPTRAGWLWGRLAAVSDGWYRLRAEPRFLATLTALVGLQVSGQVLSFWTSFGAMGIRVELLDASAAAALAGLASALSITPGALGIYEAVVASVGAAVAITPVHSVMAALVSRAVQLVLLLILTPLAILALRRRSAGTMT
jgi:uncharacterized membrane protein YbhN (UPF0104 family)